MEKSPFRSIRGVLWIVGVILFPAPIALGHADLAVTSVDLFNLPLDEEYFPGGEIFYGVDLENHGHEGSNDFTVDCYAVEDRLYNPKEYYVGSTTRTGMNAGEWRQIGVRCRLPLNIPAGLYEIKATVTCSNDDDPSDNWDSMYWPLEVVIPHPNLSVRLVDASGDCYRPGDSVAITSIVRNVGNLNSGSYSIDYYAAISPSTMTSGYRLGTAGGNPLDRSQQETVSTTCQFPLDMTEGKYFICAKVACSGDVNPGNDTGYDGALVWVGPFSDLAVQSVDAADGTCMSGGQILVHSVVQNVGDRISDGYVVHYYVSLDTTVTTRDPCIGSESLAALAPGEQRACGITCQLPLYSPEGKCYIGAIITCPSDPNPQNDCGVDGTAVTMMHPPGYVCGRITYRDLENWVHPVRYALVRVYDVDGDNDPLDDRVVGETYTDQDGNYSILILMDEKSGRQVYVKAFTQAVPGVYAGTTSRICSVQDDVLHQVYSLKSPLYPHPQEASLTASMTTQGGEFMVYDSVIEGFHKAKTFFGIEPNEITTYWPSSDNGTYYDPNSGIHIAQGDRGDRDVVMHEYGHFVAQLANFAQGAVGDHPMHYWNIDLRYSPANRIEEHARNLAFREAWATLFSIATQYGDTWYCYSGDVKYQDYDEKLRTRFTLDLEKETGYHRRPGEFYENMNASTLWDIFDDNCDGVDNRDTLSDTGLTKIWTVLNESKPENMKCFWNAWFERYTYAKEMIRLFSDNGMSFPYLGPSTAVEGFETSDFSAFAWMHPTDVRWIVTPDVRHQGAYSARTGILGNSQKTTLEISIKVDGGSIRFWRKVSTEEGFDRFQFLIDGSMMCEWSGEHDWEQFAFSVQPGTHTFTWTYGKNYTTAEGADAAWIDDIEFPIW